MNGADALAGALKAHGVEWMATLCGHGLDEIAAACERADLRRIDVRNEQTAAYAADAWGRLSGGVGVCAVSSGVAHANALAGVVNAHFDGAPMLLLAGAGPLATAGKGHFQDLDQVALARPVCKYAGRLDRAERVPELVHEALATALAGRPGPVHLTFPMDVQAAPVATDLPMIPTTAHDRVAAPAPDALRRAAELLGRCRRPVVVAGSGCHYAGAGHAVSDLASTYAIPVVVPIWDRGCVSQRRPEYIGVVGAASGGPRLLEEADLVLLLGAAADYRVGYLEAPPLAADAAVIRVDVDAERLHHLGRADLSVLADPVLFLEGLADACAAARIAGFEPWLARVQARTAEFVARLRAGAEGGVLRPEAPLHAVEVCDAVGEALTDDTVLIVDGGNIGQWAHHTLGRQRYPGTWLTCGASGVVGFGIGAAMAARAGFPRRPVILLSGDGSATFNLTDLESATRQGLPFVMVVADDEAWGIALSGQRRRYGAGLSSELGPVDFAAAAAALGAEGVAVEDGAHLRQALRRALATPRPVVLHARSRGGLPGEGR